MEKIYTAKEQANNRRNTKLCKTLDKLRDENDNPITRWRIFRLYRMRDMDIYNDLHKFFCEYDDLADKSEIERMKHERRPELKELLIQFSNYL